FQKFKDGMGHLHARVTMSGMKLIHVTPPVFDALPLKGRTLPAGRETYPQPYEGYDDVLTRYSEWLMGQRTNGWEVVDAHTPMVQYLQARRRTQPDFKFAGDGVHADAMGHWVIAQQLLQEMRVMGGTSIPSVDLEQLKVMGNHDGKVTRGENGAFQFTWNTDESAPRDPSWDADAVMGTYQRWFRIHAVRFMKAPERMYDVFEGDKLIATQTRAGINGLGLDELPDSSIARRGRELLRLLRQKNQMMTDAWLTQTGHKRPGMATGLPLAEAQAKAAELEKQIRPLTENYTLNLTIKPSSAPFPGKRSDWNGFDRYDFIARQKMLTVVAPKNPAPGRPWVWHGEFFGHKPAPDIALLGKGFHIVYASIPNLLGGPEAVRHWNYIYREMTNTYQLAPKVALVGLSRGGLYCYNWAEANPDKVACIYGDAPVCDFKSWPGGKGKSKGSPQDWQFVMYQYGFKTEAEALAYAKNPIDNLAPLAAAKVPLLHVYGDADDVVPWEENTKILAERYRQLGGEIVLIAKPGVGHHPHGLDDSAPIIDFIATNSLPKESATPAK
ncbi:MAG TPA: prolyl oligopeptidase family serine peptidase, partial [Verrucomicrobiae bacterium]|nr:prolyl oligopeptidase family serine peptidase [Verrucomicrobiae bacterium]